MNPASDPAPSRDRLARFRELRARLDPSGDPAAAMAELYVEGPGSVSARIAAELSLAPRSSHLLIGGVGSGKTTQLLATHELVWQVHDVRALYIDVSKRHDIAKMAPGVVVVQVGLELASDLNPTPQTEPFTKRLREIAHGYFEPWVPDYEDDDREQGDMVPGLLVPPEQIAANVQQALQPLEGLLGVLRDKSEHLIVMLDGLDRMTDMQAFEQIVIHDVKALTSAGVGVVIVGPLRALYGIDRTVTERFDSLHYQPWIDVRQVPSGRVFLSEVLRKRVPAAAFSDPGIDEIVLASGGVLRDVLTLAQSACVEAYLNGSDRVDLAEVDRAIDTFGRKHLQGLRPAELEVLQRVRTKGSFVQTSEDDLALLMTRRVLEYRNQNQPRYAVHPTIEKLLQELAGK
jgi:hypothetical protein